MGIEIFGKETFVLSQIPCSLIGHLGKPYIFPDCDIVAFDIFEKKSDVHEQIEAVAFFYLVVLLR
jgi:hypothetical protein